VPFLLPGLLLGQNFQVETTYEFCSKIHLGIMNMESRRFKAFTQICFMAVVLSLVLSACGIGVVQSPTPSSLESTGEPTKLAPAPTQTQPVPTSTPTPVAPIIWIDPRLPQTVQQNLGDLGELKQASKKGEATLSLTIDVGTPIGSWVYALAAPFATVTDNVTVESLIAYWQNDAEFPARVLVMPSGIYDSLKTLYGNPRADVRPLAEEDLLTFCKTHDNAWAIVPFEKLEPQWKVISLDGTSPIHKDFNAEDYPLILRFGWEAGVRAVTDAEMTLVNDAATSIPVTNRDAGLLTTVVLTGVTALVRGTAKEMEMNGVLSPAVSIGDLMREADIAHVSNEVPFAVDCPAPQWVQEVDLVFCSDDKYIDLLRDIGTDVVELTGDHFSDWGDEAMYHTLEMYHEEGWSYYGGGADITEANEPLKITHNGNKIAFLGCNAKAPGYATASETTPGALHCDMDDMVEKIQSLKDEGYLVIFTLQHQEIYRWIPTEQMIEDSRLAAEAGATIVSGSQAHQPHIYEFYGDSFIHYGLGNLFFDQLGWFEDSNKAFLDRHVFYDGKYLGVELITVQFFNWSTPTLMTAEARAEMLSRQFEYSETE